ncbi:cytochrome P450 [Phyllosticta capitalensis]
MLYAVITIILVHVFWNVVGLVKNIRKARSIGVPVVWTPVRPDNPLWVVTSNFLIPFIRRLPFGGWADYSTVSWYWSDRKNGCEIHRKYGKVFAHAMPGQLAIHTSDPAMIHQVVNDRRHFQKYLGAVRMLDIYGPSLVSINGDDWLRHRRITTRSFGESVHRIVWQEAMRQSEEMIDMWSREERGFRSTFKDSTALTLHVLARAAFGFQYDFRDSSEEILPKNHVRGYRECLSKVFQMYNIVYLNIVPDLVFRFRWTPWQLRDLKVCSLELNKYLVESVEACKKSGGPDSDKNLNFLESLVRENQVTDSKSGGLSDQELYGNLFTWTLGGHETTAHTLGFAIFLLAAFPTVQDWLFEELDGVPLTYESFPRMKRCLAVMLESLRLFPSVATAPRTSGALPTTLQTMEGKDVIVPPHTNVNFNIPALQILPEVWGPDPLMWRPARWLETDHGQLRTPVDGSFEPWSDGPRSCPGKKFAQVEFVAVIAQIFSRYRIEPVAEGDERAEDARKRVWKAAHKVHAGLTLRIENPEKVAFRMIERGASSG